MGIDRMTVKFTSSGMSAVQHNAKRAILINIVVILVVKESEIGEDLMS